MLAIGGAQIVVLDSLAIQGGDMNEFSFSLSLSSRGIDLRGLANAERQQKYGKQHEKIPNTALTAPAT